jgi:glutathione synthase/RimK-type ligase-like ATP-grasp enzyme
VKPVAFVTHPGQPDISADDFLAAQALRGLGFEVVAAVWDDPRVVWTDFAVVVLRSTWDYHTRIEAYRAWLEARANDGTSLQNSAHSVLDNLNKSYLLGLEKRGLPILPFSHHLQKNDFDLHDLLEARGWQDAVIKPAISASAFGTWRTLVGSAKQDQARLTAQLEQTDLLVQPFAPEIQHLGEWSLVFFLGQYSHAVLKKPAANDFRVQTQFGGNASAAVPDGHLIAQAQEVLTALNQTPLYARVDGIEREGQFWLLELEIHEPHLFLGTDQSAAKRFAEAIAEKILADR